MRRTPMRPRLPIRIPRSRLGRGVAVTAAAALGCAGITAMAMTLAGTTTPASRSATANAYSMGAVSPAHVVNPFAGAKWYVNPDYKAEVATSVAGASGTLAAKMKLVGNQPTAIWLDHIGAIYGGSDNSGRPSPPAPLYGGLR